MTNCVLYYPMNQEIKSLFNSVNVVESVETVEHNGNEYLSVEFRESPERYTEVTQSIIQKYNLTAVDNIRGHRQVNENGNYMKYFKFN